MCGNDPSFNPERIGSFSPGLARFREGPPWVVAFNRHNPARVASQSVRRQIQPLQGCAFFVFSPRVARCPAFAALRRGNDPSFNPERIGSFSPGLARFREGLPWVVAFNRHNPARVASQSVRRQIQPLQGCAFFDFLPRVARGAQPWAESSNRVAIAKTNGNFSHA